MRAEADELQHGVIRLAVNQDQVRLDMTVSVVLPLAAQCVVAVLLGQWLVVGQRLDQADELALQRQPVRAFGFAFQIVPELTGLLNRPHRARLAGRRA